MTDGPPIHSMECRNQVSVNDVWSPIRYMECGKHVTMRLIWSPIPFMECGNLVNVNDSYGLPYLMWNMGTLLWGPSHV